MSHLAEQERISTKNKLTGEKIFVMFDESEINGNKIVNIFIGFVHEPENLFFGNPSHKYITVRF